MGKSIIQTERECYFCGRHDVELHHCIHGTSNRKNADKYGLTIWVCREHHDLIHHNRAFDLATIQMAQAKFQETHTEEEFRKIFGKSWL